MELRDVTEVSGNSQHRPNNKPPAGHRVRPQGESQELQLYHNHNYSNSEPNHNYQDNYPNSGHNPAPNHKREQTDTPDTMALTYQASWEVMILSQNGW